VRHATRRYLAPRHLTAEPEAEIVGLTPAQSLRQIAALLRLSQEEVRPIIKRNVAETRGRKSS
jgi:hypothetical protein